MEKDEPKNEHGEAAPEGSPLSPSIDANDRAKRTEKTKQKTKANKKWGFKQHWNSASNVKRLQWVGGGILGFAALVYYSNDIIRGCRSEQHYVQEHRPKLIFSRPPDLIGNFDCYVSKQAIHLHAGQMRVWLKNIGPNDAVGVFVDGPHFKLVPEKKTGDSFVDNLPQIEPTACEVRPTPKMKMFPLERNQEIGIDITQGVGVESLGKTTSISAAFGDPQKEPIITKGTETIMARDARFQLYGPICVYYQGLRGIDDEKSYGSCMTYLLNVAKHSDPNDESGFACTETPVSGEFRQTFFSYCEN